MCQPAQCVFPSTTELQLAHDDVELFHDGIEGIGGRVDHAAERSGQVETGAQAQHDELENRRETAGDSLPPSFSHGRETSDRKRCHHRRPDDAKDEIVLEATCRQSEERERHEKSQRRARCELVDG